MKFHKTKTKRKLITLLEWQNYYGIERNRMRRITIMYGKYDPTDIISLFTFYKYLLDQGLIK